jgi:hypothetical protein
MITGLRKADRIMFRPFGTYFHVYRDELLRSPNWLIVGYGFRDPHVNQALAQARSNWRARGAPQRILVVDKYSFRAADEEGYEHAWPGVDASDFLDRILSEAFRDDLRQFHEGKAPSVRRGTVNEITDEVAVWLDGAESAFTTNLTDICSWLRI